MREAALRRTHKLGIALTAVVAVGLAASVWFWRDAETQRGVAQEAVYEDWAQTFGLMVASFSPLVPPARPSTVRGRWPRWPRRSTR